MIRQAAITIDLDGIDSYLSIHGLPQHLIEKAAQDSVYTTALSRFTELLEELNLLGTLFVVGRQVDRHRDPLRQAARAGHELANHSFSHAYDLSEWPEAAMERDLARAHQVLVDLSPDAPVVGFRAPGYNLSDPMVRALEKMGYAYDASALPSPTYFRLRSLAIRGHQLLGRDSASIRGEESWFSGRLQPHSLRSLTQYPIAVEPRTRLPWIGTTCVLLPAILRKLGLRSILKNLDVVVFEMHGIDLLDHTDSGVPARLVEFQRDLRVPATQKRAVFREVFDQIRRDREILTLGALHSSRSS
jgi:peptidoglycan-N-acetylglucosamine deacetylase